MNLKIALALILGVTSVSGCAVKNNQTQASGLGLTYHSDITENNDGTYSAAVEAALFAGRIGGAKSQVTKDAVEKCDSMGKAMKPIKEETSPHLLINGVAKLTFSCI